MHLQRTFIYCPLAARNVQVMKNVALAPPPGLISSVFVYTVNKVIVQSYQVADKSCRAQTRALSPW